MIVTDPDDLRDIVKGKHVEVRQNGEAPELGAVLPVQSRVGKKATCHVMVKETWPHSAGGYVAVVVRSDRVQRHVPRLLRAGGGYTSDPGKTTHVGAEPEPEAVPRDWVDPGAAIRVAQQAALDRATRERLSLGGQIDAHLDHAHELGVENFGREIARLEAARDALERRINRERQQLAA